MSPNDLSRALRGQKNTCPTSGRSVSSDRSKVGSFFFLENTNSVDFISIYDLYVTAASSRSVQGRQAKVTNNDTIRYDTRCYFNVRSKADMSQLNLPHGQVA